MAAIQEEVFACSVSEFVRGTEKKRITVNDNDIFIVKIGDKYFALDSFCYHAGGPLYNGDIEELGGRACMVCPWHKYKVCIDTGQNFYQSVDPKNPKTSVKWTAGQRRHRTHAVIVRDGKIYVTLTEKDGTLDSDQYNGHRA
ncbi:RFESD-like protein [Mya arenaria]|uniref:RFESD-like protein n=1 Tax=Mya arenaria TaxID=6604 RepID=A0ABY7FNH5_MYAAR|nr:Rieske domain-containing protein-like isoform X2 [Mya arenaria]WAR23785.1 RFESD-like protein [Mya arenaria]